VASYLLSIVMVLQIPIVPTLSQKVSRSVRAANV